MNYFIKIGNYVYIVIDRNLLKIVFYIIIIEIDKVVLIL